VHELILMRHAQAAPAELGAEDFTRPLTGAGRRAAAQAGRTLAATGVQIERILLSPATRTRETAAIVARELKVGETLLQAVPELYAAPPAVIRTVIARHHGGARRVLVVGHNPGISDLAAQVSAHHKAKHLPTAGLCRLPLTDSQWRQLTQP
jgi:phosphohistidine phosphatase SixA